MGAGFALTPEYIFEGDRLGDLCCSITEWLNRHYSKVGHDVLCDFIQSRYTIVRNWSSARGAVFENIRENAQGLADWVPRISYSLPLFVINAPAGAGKTMLAARLIEKASQEGRLSQLLEEHRRALCEGRDRLARSLRGDLARACARGGGLSVDRGRAAGIERRIL